MSIFLLCIQVRNVCYVEKNTCRNIVYLLNQVPCTQGCRVTEKYVSLYAEEIFLHFSVQTNVHAPIT